MNDMQDQHIKAFKGFKLMLIHTNILITWLID